jgi:hypothetical protein
MLFYLRERCFEARALKAKGLVARTFRTKCMLFELGRFPLVLLIVS